MCEIAINHTIADGIPDDLDENAYDKQTHFPSIYAGGLGEYRASN
jgi:hypothetical protein